MSAKTAAQTKFDKLLKRADKGDTKAIRDLMQIAVEREDERLLEYTHVLVQLVIQTFTQEMGRLRDAQNDAALRLEEKQSLRRPYEPYGDYRCLECGELPSTLYLPNGEAETCGCRPVEVRHFNSFNNQGRIEHTCPRCDHVLAYIHKGADHYIWECPQCLIVWPGPPPIEQLYR